MPTGQTCLWDAVNERATLAHILHCTHSVSIWAHRLSFAGLGRLWGLWFSFSFSQFGLIEGLQFSRSLLDTGHLFPKLRSPSWVRKSSNYVQRLADFTDQAHVRNPHSAELVP